MAVAKARKESNVLLLLNFECIGRLIPASYVDARQLKYKDTIIRHMQRSESVRDAQVADNNFTKISNIGRGSFVDHGNKCPPNIGNVKRHSFISEAA